MNKDVLKDYNWQVNYAGFDSGPRERDFEGPTKRWTQIYTWGRYILTHPKRRMALLKSHFGYSLAHYHHIWRERSDPLAEVLTPAEIAALFDRKEDSIRWACEQAIRLSQTWCRKSGKTWLIRRDEAEQRWK